jgi:O-acetylhomoserine (thiol)-lyase
MKQHVANAHELMNWLLDQENVSWVNHPDLETNTTNDVAKRLFPKGAGSMVCFGIQGGRAAGAAFIDALQLGSNLANVGDSRTLVLHPGSTTHSRLSPEQMVAAGISEDMIRVSVGIESIKDIKADFANGLRAAKRVVERSTEAS